MTSHCRSKMEVWRDIKGYEGLYQVSNLGRVKSLSRKVKREANSFTMTKNRILKAGNNGSGYLFVRLCVNKKIKNYYVHQLVAMAFLGHEPCGHKLVVDHVDNDKTNNKLDNLQLISSRDNVVKDTIRGASKYVGVSINNSRGKKWVSRIIFNGVSEHLGCYDNELDAAKAYQDRLKEVGYANV